MENERSVLKNLYGEKVDKAHEAFRQKEFSKLAELFFEQGEIATKIYNIDGSEEWDIRIYLAFNAAGGELKSIGNYKKARTAFLLALASCERVATGRSDEWQKNINHLKSQIEQAND